MGATVCPISNLVNDLMPHENTRKTRGIAENPCVSISYARFKQWATYPTEYAYFSLSFNNLEKKEKG